MLISGHGGSGKSTLAETLAQQFDVRPDQIFRLDTLCAKNYIQKEGLFELHDWKTVLDILSHVRTSKWLNYPVRDDRRLESAVDVPRPRVLLLEGIRLIRPETLPYADISVWIDYPLEVATELAKERNRQQGDSEEEIALWDSKWLPEPEQYDKQVSPQKLASFVYKEYN